MTMLEWTVAIATGLNSLLCLTTGIGFFASLEDNAHGVAMVCMALCGVSIINVWTLGWLVFTYLQ